MAEEEAHEPASACLSPGLADDAAAGSDALLQTIMESMAGTIGWIFEPNEDTASPESQPVLALEEGGMDAQREGIAEAPAQTNNGDENTIAAMGDDSAAVNAEVDEAAEATKPDAIANSDTVVSDSSASSVISNNKERGSAEQEKRRSKLIWTVAVGLVMVVAIIVGAVLGAAAGNQSKSEIIQSESAQMAVRDSFLSESDGSASPSLPTARPSLRPTPNSADQGSNVDTYVPSPFSFLVIGDVPYNPREKVIVQDQIKLLSEDVTDEDLFMIHVGDTMNAKQGCSESDFEFTRDLLTSELPHLPCFIIPGDNDWDDCPDRSMAWKRWEKHYMGFENNWNGTERFALFQGSVQRQSIRKENFAFVTHGVLFFSLHWLGGASGAKDSRTAARMAHNDAWIEEQAMKHKASIESGRIRAVIIAGHALTKSNSSLNTLQVIKDSFEGYGIPVIFFKGDKHTFEVCESFLGIGWEKFKIVQVDQGGIAPPVRVSVLGEGIGSSNPSGSNATITLSDFIQLDRRGGVYSGTPDLLPNACGAVSRGEVY